MSSMDTENTRFILWTGGFDSTFMLLQFARQDLVIQPIYVIDPGRKSTQYEIDAMNEIITLLETKFSNEVKAIIKPITIYELKDIVEDEHITECYKKLSKRIKLGSQYEWLARLASMYPFLDIGVEKQNDSYSGCQTAVLQDGGYVVENGIGRLNSEESSEVTKTVLGRFRFPIYNITESEMYSAVQAWNWNEIIQKIWFCHDPINGQPCGLCRPCQQKMGEGQLQFMPTISQKRYKVYCFISGIVGVKMADKMSSVYRRIKNKDTSI